MSRSTTAILVSQTSRSAGETAVAIIEATKPGITRLVTITAVVGLATAASQTSGWAVAELARLLVGCVLGTAMAAGGANALNQWLERGRDALMPRTADRPLPSGRLHPLTVLWLGVIASLGGVTVLWATCGPIAALIALTCVMSYIFFYTPLKTRSVFNTLMGAVPGALPPMIGTAAVSNAGGFAPLLEPLGLALFALMFVWQLPHFLAIAWMYRDDYDAGGYRMLPQIDPNGVATAAIVVVTSVLLVPASLLPALIPAAPVGLPYVLVASAGGAVMLALSIRLAVLRTRAAARGVFFGSIAQLPLVLMALTLESVLRGLL